MSVKLRLKRMGTKKRPFYRLVAMDSRKARDGRFIEELGYYNPLTDPATVHIEEGLVFKWFERGAIPSTNAANLLRKLGYVQKWELMKQGLGGADLEQRVEAIRNQREQAAARRQERRRADKKSDKARAKESTSKEAGTEATGA